MRENSKKKPLIAITGGEDGKKSLRAFAIGTAGAVERELTESKFQEGLAELAKVASVYLWGKDSITKSFGKQETSPYNFAIHLSC